MIVIRNKNILSGIGNCIYKLNNFFFFFKVEKNSRRQAPSLSALREGHPIAYSLASRGYNISKQSVQQQPWKQQAPKFRILL